MLDFMHRRKDELPDEFAHRLVAGDVAVRVAAEAVGDQHQHFVVGVALDVPGILLAPALAPEDDPVVMKLLPLNHRVEGSVVDREGQPIPKVEMQVVSLDNLTNGWIYLNETVLEPLDVAVS